jgi:hypothetical protein
MGMNRPVTQRATHYHTRAISPVWSASLVETTRIGAHIFYRFPNQVERRALRAGVAEAPGGVEGGLLITPDTEVITPEVQAPLLQLRPETPERIEAARVEPLLGSI